MARLLAQIVFALYLSSVLGQIVFTGISENDFNLPPATDSDKRRITMKQIVNTNNLTGTPTMEAIGRRSGFDLKYLFVQYDWIKDELNVAFDCWAVCGDADGDGNPSVWSDPFTGKRDYPLQNQQEWTTIGIMTKPAPEYQPATDNWIGYYPDVGVGDSLEGGFLPLVVPTDPPQDLPPFTTWVVRPEDWCLGQDENDCPDTRATNFLGFSEHFEVPIPSTSRDPDVREIWGVRAGIQDIDLPKFPNQTWPDLQFRIRNFSLYGQFNFVKGVDPIKFAFHTSTGSYSDYSGEDVSFPQVLEIPCLIKDECGVCNGNNTKCADCRGVPNGDWVIDGCSLCVPPAQYRFLDACDECVPLAQINRSIDACGVCFGENKSCSDCSGVPHGTKKVDKCGVCGGENKDIDPCGKCFGDGSSCADCAGVPNGDAVYDDCGVCDGFNLAKDLCGICFGDNTYCADCAGTPNGHLVYDVCGVCGGTNETCKDCNGVPNGDWVVDNCSHCVPPSEYQWLDLCGKCGGDNTSCADCAGVPNGPNFIDGCDRCRDFDNGEVWDACHVCGGDNSTCTDCGGNKIGSPTPSHIDNCGNCIDFGESETPVDDCGRCNGVNQDKDVCGVCFGNSDTCYGCDGIPASGLVYDNCGVCGGDNRTCECFIYTPISISAADTWIDLRNRTQNHGRDVDLIVSSDKQRSLLRFDDIRFLINGATEQRPEILNATLKLFVRGEVMLGDYHMGWKESGKLSVHVLDNNFCEDKATWECRDYDATGCCVQWRMLALYPKVKADYAFTETVSVDLKELEGHRGYINFDVTEDIKEFMSHGFLNSRSYLVKKDCETDWGWIKFWSCDTPGKMNCPTLEINLKSRCFPEDTVPEPEPEVC